MAFANTDSSVTQILTTTNDTNSVTISGPLPGEVGVATATVAKWKVPCTSIDNAALTLFNKVTRRQLDIATVGSNAGLASACYSSNTAVLTTLYGDLVSGTGVTFGQSLGIVGVGTTTNVAYGVIKYDTLQAYQYPKLETLDVSGNNPLEGEGYVTITSSNTGIGKLTAYTRGAGSSAGTVFAFVSSGCASYTGIANSLSSVKAQYDSEYTGMSSHINNANLLKGYKHSAQLEWWSLNKCGNNLSVGITSNTSAASIIASYP